MNKFIKMISFQAAKTCDLTSTQITLWKVLQQIVLQVPGKNLSRTFPVKLNGTVQCFVLNLPVSKQEPSMLIAGKVPVNKLKLSRFKSGTFQFLPGNFPGYKHRRFQSTN